jgi:hypothetical protein
VSTGLGRRHDWIPVGRREPCSQRGRQLERSNHRAGSNGNVRTGPTRRTLGRWWERHLGRLREGSQRPQRVCPSQCRPRIPHATVLCHGLSQVSFPGLSDSVCNRA